MHRYRAFTLVEMLAVVSIMLVLLGVTYGIFTTLAQQQGPDSVLVTLQAAMHNARDYAASEGVSTRLVFRKTEEGNTSNQLESTRLILQYIPKGESEFEDVPGWQEAALPRGLFVIHGYPSGAPPSGAMDADDVDENDIEQYQKKQQQFLGKLKQKFDESTQRKFAIEFGPAGYPPADPVTSDMDCASGLIVVRLAGNNVVGYAFLPFNPNTGTRLIFTREG